MGKEEIWENKKIIKISKKNDGGGESTAVESVKSGPLCTRTNLCEKHLQIPGEWQVTFVNIDDGSEESKPPSEFCGVEYKIVWREQPKDRAECESKHYFSGGVHVSTH